MVFDKYRAMRNRGGKGPMKERELETGLYLRMRACLGPRQTAGAGPGEGALLAVHLPGVLLVVEYLLVSSTWSVLHVGQRANPARHFKFQLLVVNLKSHMESLG